MFFMFSLFSLFSSHPDSTPQKKPQAIAPHEQFAHRVSSSASSPKAGPSYSLHEQTLQPIAQHDSAVQLTPIMPMGSMPRVMLPAQDTTMPASCALPSATIMQPPPIVINNYTNCSPSVVSEHKSEVQMNNSLSAQASANVSACMEQAQQMLHQELPQQMVSLQALLWEYRYRIAGGCVVAVYILLCYRLYKALQYLSQKAVWSLWHKELSMEELLAQDIAALGKSLIIVIHMRYANPQNPTDFIAPLVAFNVHIQQEIEELRAHWRLYMACKDWRLVKIVPFNLDRLEALKEHIERAVYVQTVFKTWTANYTFVQNVRAHVA